MPSVFEQLADAFIERKKALSEGKRAKSALPGSDYFMPESSKKDLANQLSVFEQGGLPGVLKEGAQKMYENPVVNTAISLTPGAGDIQSGYEAVRSANEGKWGEAGLNALGVLPFVPALGGMTKGAKAIDEITGLPLNPNGTVTVYHHTSPENAKQIAKTGTLRSAGEPDVYVTSWSKPDTGYGESVVPIQVDPSILRLDDEFPSGRMDFAIPVNKSKEFKFDSNKFNVTKKDASDIFGEGATRIKYQDPNSQGFIDVLQRPDGTASVLGLEVPEAARGKGVGKSLQKQVLSDFPEMQGQVSSKAAATSAYNLGRRPVGQSNATLNDVYKMIDEDTSVNLVSPKMQKRFDMQNNGISVFEFPKD